MKERRKSERVKVKLSIDYDTFSQGRVHRSGMSEDLSLHGIKIRIAKEHGSELAKGQPVSIEIHDFSKDLPFFIGGRVVWLIRDIADNPKDSFVGIEFEEVDDFQRKKIARYIRGIEGL